ncbi:zinc finger protein RFP-like [Sceloporus undulatus]|uniref:zinc finger protein RFP-like n=1 Tax=Sceloporus undulatus TaxID=8520 RepID=UPI001C4B27CE|nr:zinc finger protein RFP-like [Sceloporus undulatus]
MDKVDNPMEELQKAAICSICLEYFKDPVSIQCGHNFCLRCITECCEKAKRRFCCPHCRRQACKRDFRPNRELANVAEVAKRYKMQAEEAAGEKAVCERHREPLKLFCEDDQALICVVCDRSKDHRAHTVLPIEEAVQDYKEQIQNQSLSLKQERERLQELKQDTERMTGEVLETLNAEWRKVTSESELLHQLLEEKEQALLDQLNELKLEIKKEQKENDTKYSEKMSLLVDLVSEMEEKCKQPDSEFLQNVKDILSRSKKRHVHLLSETPLDLKNKLNIFVKNTVSLVDTLKKCKASLLTEHQEKEEAVSSAIAIANVTLDLDTAGPYLILSDNRKSAWLGNKRQKRANSWEQFSVYPCVLGCEGFISGKHSWEVEVVEEGCWAVGVARKSVNRKTKLRFHPEEGIWSLEHLGANHYRALTSPPTPLHPTKPYRRILVCLDYEEGEVAFFNAENGDRIFTFPSSLFSKERLHPWLWVGLRSQLRLHP